MDNNFKNAQRSYDNQVPPECETEAFDCEDCEGTGYMGKGEVCKTCNGNGFIELTPAEIKKLKRLQEPEDPDDADYYKE